MSFKNFFNKNKIIYKYLSDIDRDYKMLEDAISNGEFGNLFSLDTARKSQIKNEIILNSKATAERLNSPNEFKRLIKRHFNLKYIPTKYDDAGAYLILKELIKEVEKELTSKNLVINNFPLFASLPTGKISAIATKVEKSNKSFILFDSNFFLYCHLFTKSFLALLPTKIINGDLHFGFGVTNYSPDINEEMIFRTVDLMKALIIDGDIHKTEPWGLIEGLENVIAGIRTSMELFVVAHEYGHIYFSHLDSEAKGINETDECLIQNLNTSQRQELEADTFAANLTYDILSPSRDVFNPPLHFLGIYLFFVASEMFKKVEHFSIYNSMKNYDENKSTTHPSFKIRKNNIRNISQKNTYNYIQSSEITNIFNSVDLIQSKLTRIIIKELFT